jgi:hypothetical protein
MSIEFNSFNKSEDVDLSEVQFSSLKFPIDLDDKQYYPECIKFGIYERAGLSIEKLGTAIVDAFSIPQSATISSRPKVSVRGIGPKAIGADSTNVPAKVIIEESTVVRDFIGEGVDKVRRGAKALTSTLTSENKAAKLQVQNPTARLVQSIYLQMPESLVYNEQIDWQGTDLGLVGAFKDGVLGAGLAAGAMANAGKMLGGAAGTLLSVLPGIGSTAGVLIGTLLGGESGISGGIESSFNVKANPYKEQTFQGVPFRPFEFSFNFRPRNETEVEEVDKIIRAFRAYSKPSFKQQGESGVFAYPHEFLIEFLTLNKGTYSRNKYIPQIKFCICKSVNTNWTGQGWKSFRDGAPVDITLTLSFEETEIITQGDVVKGDRTGIGDFATFGGDF